MKAGHTVPIQVKSTLADGLAVSEVRLNDFYYVIFTFFVRKCDKF